MSGSGTFSVGPLRDLGHLVMGCFVMGCLVMGPFVMGHFALGRFVLGRLVCESFCYYCAVLRSRSRKEPHLLVGARAVTRRGSGSDGSGSDNGIKHG
jgi:hypothetical protein